MGMIKWHAFVNMVMNTVFYKGKEFLY